MGVAARPAHATGQAARCLDESWKCVDAGMSDEEIKGRQRLLEQDVVASTARALKEHFILQKIAEEEKIEIQDADIDTEIDRIADRTG